MEDVLYLEAQLKRQTTGKQYIIPNGCGTYLPPHFWYNGMHKVKAGKGYRDGRPIGVIGGPCDDCGSDTISIKMNTSSKGFETTSERVCKECGLVHPTSFQVIEKRKEYKSKYYDTYDAWLEDMKTEPSYDDTGYDSKHEYNMQLAGRRDGLIYAPGGYNVYGLSHKRLALAIRRLADTPASIKQPMKSWRQNQYHEIADDYIHELELNKLDAADVHYYIDNRDTLFKMDYKVEDIILCICIYVQFLSLSKQKRGGLMFKYCSLYGDIKTLYSLIVQKLNS